MRKIDFKAMTVMIHLFTALAAIPIQAVKQAKQQAILLTTAAMARP